MVFILHNRTSIQPTPPCIYSLISTLQCSLPLLPAVALSCAVHTAHWTALLHHRTVGKQEGSSLLESSTEVEKERIYFSLKWTFRRRQLFTCYKILFILTVDCGHSILPTELISAPVVGPGQSCVLSTQHCHWSSRTVNNVSQSSCLLLSMMSLSVWEDFSHIHVLTACWYFMFDIFLDILRPHIPLCD